MENIKTNYILSLGLILILIVYSTLDAQTSFNISNQTTGDTLLTIDNSGNVGIGKTTPGFRLEVNSPDPNISASFGLANLDISHYLHFYSGRLNSPNPVILWNDGDSLRFGTSLNTFTEYMRLTSGGNLGIGTTSPDEKLTLSYDSFIGWEYSSGNSSVAHKIGKSSNGAGPLEFITTYNPGATGQTFSFKNPTERLTILYNGNVGIGTTTPRTMLEVADTIYSSFGGFQFPDGTVQETAAIGGGGVTEINDLTDGKTGGNSVFLGQGAGFNDDGSNNNNTGVGRSTLALNTTGSYNTGVGVSSLVNNTGGYSNTAYGYYSLLSNTTGNNNVGIGLGANRYNQGGSNNTIIGYNAGGGSAVHSKSGNVFIGYDAGRWETGDNKLYIENSSSATPLIGGDFAADQIYLNGRVGIGTGSPSAGLHLVGSGYPNSFLFLESQDNADAGIRLYEGTTANWHIFNNATLDGLQIYNNLGQNVFFANRSTTNVGIGTTTPGAKLEIAGQIKITGGNPGAGRVLISDANGLATWQSANTFAIGDQAFGGIVFWVDPTGQHGLVCAEVDQGTSNPWTGAAGGINTEAHGNGLAAGEMNTTIIIATQGPNVYHYAAGLCLTLAINDNGNIYGDWYLPSRYELALIYNNLHLAGLGNFSPNFYWSSTESDNNNSWAILFGNGQELTLDKTIDAYVRAVRAF